MSELTHLDSAGQARMVDVSAKAETERTAVAEGRVHLSQHAFEQVRNGTLPKGEIGPIVRLAGTTGAKWTSHLIPLCHPVRLTDIVVEMTLEPEQNTVVVQATTRAVDRTGVEMEAMTAVSIACLTLYDMVKGVDRETSLGSIQLLEKRGGKSGTWIRPEHSTPAGASG